MNSAASSWPALGTGLQIDLIGLGRAGAALGPQQLTPARRAQWLAALSTDEQACLHRLRQPADQLRYLVAHAHLRLRLAAHLGLPASAAAQVALRRGRHGKPQLAPARDGKDQHDHALQFNLSHAGCWVLIAWAAQPVGVDVEGRLPMAVTDLLPSCATAAEARAVRQSADPAQAGLQLWTAKEAVLKAQGSGLLQPPTGFDVGLPPTPLDAVTAWRPVRSAQAELAGIRVLNFAVDDDHVAAVALAPAAVDAAAALNDTDAPPAPVTPVFSWSYL